MASRGQGQPYPLAVGPDERGAYRAEPSLADVGVAEYGVVEDRQRPARAPLLEGGGANGVAGQAGDGGRVGALPAHVADENSPRAVADVEGVEEVAAHLVALARRQIAGGQLDTRDLGQRV